MVKEIYVLVSYDDGVLGAYSSEERAIYQAQSFIANEDESLVPDWDCYYHVDKTEFYDEGSS